MSMISREDIIHFPDIQYITHFPGFAMKKKISHTQIDLDK